MGPSAAPGGVGNGNWINLYGGDGFWTVPDEDGKTVFAEYQGGMMYRINLDNMKSEFIQPQKTAKEEKLRWNWNTPIVTGTKNPKNLYVGAQYLYKSTDQGRNWKRISPDLTTNNKLKQNQEDSGGLSDDNTSAENHCTIYYIAESPFDENQIWVGTDDGNLQYTTNGGNNWTNVSINVPKCGIPSQSWVSSIQLSQFDKNTLYVTFDNHMYGDHACYLAKSTDMGQTWVRMHSKEFTGFAHKVVEDFENRDLLFLGTEMGLFATLDGGKNWFRMKNDIPEYVSVYDMQIHPKTHDLVVATHGRGIFILDKIGSISQLTPEILDQEVYLFPTEDIVLTSSRFGNAGPDVIGGWKAPNPKYIPPLTYYLKQRLSTGKISLEIYDESGTLVQSIPGTSRKGLNMISWNLRGKPPRVASGGTKIDLAGFSSPMVLPGIYKLRLMVNDTEYTGTIKCVHDENNKDMDLADRKLVYDKAMELQALYNNISVLIDSISFYQNKLKADTLAFAKNKNAKSFDVELQKLKAELMATKKTSVFADEERLRERVSALYGTFCSMEVKPNTIQMDAIEALKQEFKVHEDIFNKLLKKHLPKNPGMKVNK
jgi:hypothetical protein